MNDQGRSYGGAKSNQENKIFIGGLSLQSTKDDLLDYFGRWGEITDAVVITEPDTKRSRGFGFVSYAEPEDVDKCLAERPHTVNGKEVEAKRAVPREESNPNSYVKTKKVFLGGLSLQTEERDIRDVLEPLGGLESVQIMTEKDSNKPRGFGFATFVDYDVVDKICLKKFIKIKDRDVEVKKAIPQDEIRRDASRSSWGGGGRSGGGGGRGGGHYGQRSDPYGRQAMGGGGYRDYRSAMQPGYDVGGYGGNPYYMASGNYPMAGGYDRAHQGYNYDYYGNMYAGSAGMGAYNQAASSYGPQRGYESGGRERERGMMAGARTQGHQYHPYRRM